MVKIVRTSEAVDDRLHELYSSRLAGILFGFWCHLALHGEEAIKAMLPVRTFSRRRKQLLEAAVSSSETDLRLASHSLIPEGFSPVSYDPRRCDCIAPRVLKELRNMERK